MENQNISSQSNNFTCDTYDSIISRINKMVENKVLTETKDQSKSEYDEAVAKAEEEKKQIIDDADKACAASQQ